MLTDVQNSFTYRLSSSKSENLSIFGKVRGKNSVTAVACSSRDSVNALSHELSLC